MCDASAHPVHARGTPRPRWSLLHALASVMLGALAIVEIAPLSGAWRTVLRCGLGVGGFGAITLWIRVNRVALEQEDWCDCAAATMTVREIPSPVSGATLAPWVSNGQTAIHRRPASRKRKRASAAGS